MRLTNHTKSASRAGATMVVVIMILPVLMLFVGFSVDLAYMQLSRSELSAATDLATKAASAELADTGSTSAAIAKGQEIASANTVAGKGLTLDASDFVFGNTVRSKKEKWEFTPNATPTNAVQVTGRRTTTAPDQEIGLFFSGLRGGGGFETIADATASFVNVDICLVLDRSSSMKLAVSDPSETMGGGDPRECQVPASDSRWIALDSAIDLFVSKMNTSASEEQIAIVTYASDDTSCSSSNLAVTLDQELTEDLTNVATAMNTLNSTVWNGMTETSAGMNVARQELKSGRARDTAMKIMIVLTDGAYTNGIHPESEASAALADGIQVHTITFGSCPSEVLVDMEQTATAGGGKHYHAPDAAILSDVFAEIAGAIAILTE